MMAGRMGRSGASRKEGTAVTTMNADQQVARARSPLGGREIALGVGGAIVALILQLIFIGSYVGALHDPTPHDVPIGVVAPAGQESNVIAAVGVGGQFRATGCADDAALRHAVDQLTVYGGIELTPQGAHLLVSDASSATAASAVMTFGQGFASGQNLPLSVEHVHPLGNGDPRGLTPVYLMIAWVFGGYFAAIVISQVRGLATRAGSMPCFAWRCWSAIRSPVV